MKSVDSGFSTSSVRDPESLHRQETLADITQRNADDSKIVVEPGKITIKSRTCTKKFALPDLKLYPETCRGLRCTSAKEVQFSIRAELSEGELEPALPQYSSQNDTVDKIKLEQHRWFCRICKHKIISDTCIFSRVLPLPSENWQDFADMWFCHGDQEDPSKGQGLLPRPRECFVGETFVLLDRGHLGKGAVKMVRDREAVVCGRCGKQLGNLVASETECFVGLVDRGHLGKGAVKMVRDREAVVCGRCGKQLGNLVASETDKVKLFLHTIAIGEQKEEDTTCTAIDRSDGAEALFARLLLELSRHYTSYPETSEKSDGAEALFARLLLEQSQLYTSYRFIVEARHTSTVSSSGDASSHTNSAASGVTSTCLIWLLDGNGCMYKSESAQQSGSTQQSGLTPQSGSKPQMVQQEGVVSVLFKCQLVSANIKPDVVSKTLVSLWKRDNTVHGITLPHPVFVQLLATLIHNCRSLPASQRFTNGFHVSYLRRENLPR